MKQYFIEIFGIGGEYNLGTVKDIDLYDKLLELQQENCLEISMDEDIHGDSILDDGFEVEFSEYNDVLCHFGVEVTSIRFINIEGKNCVLPQEVTDKLESDDKFMFKNISIDSPYLSPTTIEKNISEGTVGYFGGLAIEKGGYGPYKLETTGEINLNYFFTISVDLSDTLCDDEVMTELIYIEPNQMLEEINKYYTEKEYKLDLNSSVETIEENFLIIFENEEDFKIKKSIIKKYILEKYSDLYSTGKGSEALLFDSQFNFIENGN